MGKIGRPRKSVDTVDDASRRYNYRVWNDRILDFDPLITGFDTIDEAENWLHQSIDGRTNEDFWKKRGYELKLFFRHQMVEPIYTEVLA